MSSKLTPEMEFTLVLIFISVAIMWGTLYLSRPNPYVLMRTCDPKTDIGNRVLYRVFEHGTVEAFVCTQNGWALTSPPSMHEASGLFESR